MNPKKQEKQFKGRRKPGKEDKREKDPKFQQHKDKSDDTKVYLKGPNDITWRTADETMTKLVANLPFGLAAGLKQTITYDCDNPSASTTWSQPGIMAIRTYLTAGNPNTYNDALNLVSRKIYSFVRHANSGSKNYEAADMTMYFLAVGQIIGLLGYCQRALRVVKEYSSTNRYTPTALVGMMGLNFDDLVANQAQLKYIIAWLGRVLKGLAYPELPYFKACYEAFQYIFVDNDSPKEQFYMLTPAGFGIYDPVYNANGGGIVMTNLLPLPNAAPSSRLTVAQLFAYIKARTDVLLGDEDLGIISGDILKAFNKEGGSLYYPDAWDLDYPVFQHSPEMLQQIHNLVIVQESYISFAGYKQDPGTTGTAPYVQCDLGGNPVVGSKNGVPHYTIIDAFSRDPDYKEVVNCTILNPQFKIANAGGSPSAYKIDENSLSFDLFLPVGAWIKTDLSDPGGISDVGYNFTRCGTNFTTNNVMYGVTNFDWHPLVLRYYQGTFIVMADVQNIRFFTYDIGDRIHQNSLLNLFAFQDTNFFKQ